MASGSTRAGSSGGSKGGSKSGRTAAGKRFSGTKYTYDKRKAGGNTKYDDSKPW